MLNNEWKKLSPALQLLLDEHTALRAEMNHFYDLAEEIEYESDPAVLSRFVQLYDFILGFSARLEAHSEREDDGLFPMMIHHLGEHHPTMETMEFEHLKAHGHLNDFLAEAPSALSSMDIEEAQSITVYAVQAHATLTQHFAKEETVLFPLAQKILSVDEMNVLHKLFQA